MNIESGKEAENMHTIVCARCNYKTTCRLPPDEIEGSPHYKHVHNIKRPHDDSDGTMCYCSVWNIVD